MRKYTGTAFIRGTAADSEAIDEILENYTDGCSFRGCPEDDVNLTDVFEWYPPIGIEKFCVQLAS